MPYENYRNIRVLIVDNDERPRDKLSKLFQKRPFALSDEQIFLVEALEPALSLLRQHFFHIIVTDLDLGAGYENGGISLLSAASDMYPPDSIVKVLISETRDIENILDLITKRFGFKDAQAYLNKYQNEGINIFDVLFFTKDATIYTQDDLPPFINIIQRKFDRLGINLDLQTHTYDEHLIPNIVSSLTQALLEDLEQNWRKNQEYKPENAWFLSNLYYTRRELRMREEFEDLFRRLFHDLVDNKQGSGIYLTELAQGFGQARVLQVSIPGFIIDQVVKFGHRVSQSKDEVMIERRNHTLFVVDRIFNAPEIRAVSATPLLSAIRYQFAGDNQDIRSFGYIFRKHIDNAPHLIADIITKLFNETCQAWYDDNNRGDAQNYPFNQHYPHFLRCTPERVHEALQIVRQYPHENPIYFNDSNSEIVFFHLPTQDAQIHYPNPLMRLSADKDNWRTIMTYSVNLAITHGDFNAQNILITKNNQVWLIDFYRTGWSHIHRDFIQLESVIRFILFEYADATLAERYEMEQMLLQQQDFNDIDRIGVLVNKIQNRSLKHVAHLICHIRRLAGQYGRTLHGFKAYKTGLLFYCLNTIKFVKNADDVQKLNSAHALLLACMLTQDLYR